MLHLNQVHTSPRLPTCLVVSVTGRDGPSLPPLLPRLRATHQRSSLKVSAWCFSQKYRSSLTSLIFHIWNVPVLLFPSASSRARIPVLTLPPCVPFVFLHFWVFFILILFIAVLATVNQILERGQLGETEEYKKTITALKCTDVYRKLHPNVAGYASPPSCPSFFPLPSCWASE